ncbi:phage portal protein [Methyloraptor flagellatus]|uniref:Phage portal protein n=1 Tax=Methyloraptor flagellatus TaxID=3162530 RepID=A0AAU7X430_9HYPH
MASILDTLRRVAGGPARPAVAVQAEQKSSRVGPLIALQGQGRPLWSPRDYAGLAREGYARNPIVFRAVRMVCEAAASVPLLLYEDDRELTVHPLLDLIARPNPHECGRDLIEGVLGHLLVSGNAYVERVDIDGVPRELYRLRPDRMKLVPGPDGWPEAYEYSVNGRSVRFAVDGEAPSPILHLKQFHPLDDQYGFAPIEAAQVSLDVHNQASAWAKALLDNSARPSGALVYQAKDGGNLSDEQFSRLKKELEDGFQGASNAGRPLLLEGGLDWKAMGYSPKDMDFIEAKREAAREIALAFGVPPMLLGIPGDNTYSNYAEANRAFWRLTVLPLVARTTEALTGWLGPAFGARLRLGWDVDAIEALADERSALWKRLGEATFLDEDEKRLAVGYSPRGASAGRIPTDAVP